MSCGWRRRLTRNLCSSDAVHQVGIGKILSSCLRLFFAGVATAPIRLNKSEYRVSKSVHHDQQSPRRDHVNCAHFHQLRLLISGSSCYSFLMSDIKPIMRRSRKPGRTPENELSEDSRIGVLRWQPEAKVPAGSMQPSRNGVYRATCASC
jgi:hypothetical protein